MLVRCGRERKRDRADCFLIEEEGGFEEGFLMRFWAIIRD